MRREGRFLSHSWSSHIPSSRNVTADFWSSISPSTPVKHIPSLPFGPGSQLLPGSVAGELCINNRISTGCAEAGSSHKLVQKSMNWPHLLSSFCLRGDLKQYKNHKYFLTPKCLWLYQCPGRFVLPLVAGKPEAAQSIQAMDSWLGAGNLQFQAWFHTQFPPDSGKLLSPL